MIRAPSAPGSGTGGVPEDRRARRDRQRAFWQARYAEDPAFFGDRESEFARFCLGFLGGRAEGLEVVELGCGTGRDARFFASHGARVRAADLAGPDRVARGASAHPLELLDADCLDFLRALPRAGLDLVYSNMLFNMDFTEEEHRELVGAVHDALRPGGLHLYSARSTSDPWFGRGRRVGPDTFDPGPRGPPLHYFSRGYCDRLAAVGRFLPVVREERSEGTGEFPIRLWYVIDRRTADPTG